MVSDYIPNHITRNAGDHEEVICSLETAEDRSKISANANLIAAAPNLLNVCLDYSKLWKGYLKAKYNDSELHGLAYFAHRAAFDAVEGKTLIQKNYLNDLPLTRTFELKLKVDNLRPSMIALIVHHVAEAIGTCSIFNHVLTDTEGHKLGEATIMRLDVISEV